MGNLFGRRDTKLTKLPNFLEALKGPFMKPLPREVKPIPGNPITL